MKRWKRRFLLTAIGYAVGHSVRPTRSCRSCHRFPRGRPYRGGTSWRVRGGGDWTDDGWAFRLVFRLRYEPARRYDHIGFRVVLVRA